MSGTDRYYASRFVCDERRSGAWQAICNYLQSYVPPNARVLDLGAGYCSFINQIQAGEKHAIDIHAGFTKYAGPDVNARVGSCQDLSYYPTGYFDVVFESNLFEHLTRDEMAKTAGELLRVLRPSGRFIAIQPNFALCFRHYFDDYTHLQVFTHISLSDMLSSYGLMPERVEPRFLPTTFKSRFPAWPWTVKLYLALPFRPFAGQMLLVCRRRTASLG